jgi:hypothetical protein
MRCASQVERIKTPVEDSIQKINDSRATIKKSKMELYEEITRLLREAIFGIEV